MKESHKLAITQSNYLRWRRERGVKLVISISPIKNGLHRGFANFEGNEYVSTGKDNVEALQNLMSLLIEKSNLK